MLQAAWKEWEMCTKIRSRKMMGRDHLENKEMDVWMGVYWTGTCGSVLWT
jgi:hypothetical protein